MSELNRKSIWRPLWTHLPPIQIRNTEKIDVIIENLRTIPLVPSILYANPLSLESPREIQVKIWVNTMTDIGWVRLFHIGSMVAK